MFGKFFASTFTGSMMGAGPEVFAVWGYVIANTHGSQVELNPRLLSAVIGTSPETIQRAIDYLCAPDPNSRSKVEDGKRLIREGEFAYRVPNFEAYRAVRDEEDRRAYNRRKQAESRARRRTVNTRVIDSQSRLPKSALSAKTEADTETETDTEAAEEERLGIGFKEIGEPAKTTPALRGYLRASRNPGATAAVVRSFGPGGTDGRYTWEQIDRALTEMAAASVGFTQRALGGFLRKLHESPNGNEDPSTFFKRRAAEQRAALAKGTA